MVRSYHGGIKKSVVTNTPSGNFKFPFVVLHSKASLCDSLTPNFFRNSKNHLANGWILEYNGKNDALRRGFMSQDILVIGIAGGTGSGKTTLMKNLVNRFEGEITVLSHDNYYKRLDHLCFEDRCKVNYDEPCAFETELLVHHLELLRQGQTIQSPVYDFVQHNRSQEVIAVIPRRVIIVEGILIFENKALRDQMDIRIFVDTDADIRLCRRIKRDVNKRGRSLESVLLQYQQTVKPMHEKYVEPSKKHANLVVPEGGKNMVALDMITGSIRRHLSGQTAE